MPAPRTLAPPRRRRPKRKVSVEGGKEKNWGEQYHLKAIARALDVLECFSDDAPSLSLKDFTLRLQLSESTLFRILLTLESHGYLEQNADGSYRLPDRLVLGKQHERAERLRVLVHPHIEALARRFDETASAAYLYGNQARVIGSVETFQEIRLTNKVGRVLPPHCSSLGKSIAAFQEPRLAEEMVEVYGLIRRTERTIVDRRELIEEYARIRERGYAIDREEAACGGVCFGAPIRTAGGRVCGAISVSTVAVRLTPEREAAVIQAVVETAGAASRDLWG